jgi:hypothetical protein
VLGVGAELGAERAADVGRDHPHLGGLDAEHLSHGSTGALSTLVRYPRGQPAILAPHRRRGPAFHRRRGDALVDDRLGHHDFAVIEQVGLQIFALAEVRGDIGSRLLEQDRPVAQRVGVVDHGRKRLVVHVDQFDGILALIRLLRDHGRDGIADEPHLAPGQQRPRHRRVDQHAGRGRGDGGQPGQLQVVSGVDGEHPRRVERGAGVDPGDSRVGDRRADKEHVAGAG